VVAIATVQCSAAAAFYYLGSPATAYAKLFSNQSDSALRYPNIGLPGATEDANAIAISAPADDGLNPFRFDAPHLRLFERPGLEAHRPAEQLGKGSLEDASRPNARRLEPKARYASLPRRVTSGTARIRFASSLLEPFAHTRFCLQYRNDCRRRQMIFRGGGAVLTPQRWAELNAVNKAVNDAIVPERNDGGLDAERWLISPRAGDCNDYAVTKRHHLLARGWSARDLLLAEVVVSSGEHHLVLVVRTRLGDFVVDNLDPVVHAWAATPYEWVRIQTPGNPRFWSTVARASV
jgi:predicted transglutaminase-like cysteine proteinase